MLWVCQVFSLCVEGNVTFWGFGVRARVSGLGVMFSEWMLCYCVKEKRVNVTEDVTLKSVDFIEEKDKISCNVIML